MKDDCSYKVNIKLSLGKLSECHRCGESFEMSVLSARMDKPHCSACVKHKDKKEIRGFVSLKEIPIVLPATDLRARLSKSVDRVVEGSEIKVPNTEDETDML